MNPKSKIQNPKSPRRDRAIPCEFADDVSFPVQMANVQALHAQIAFENGKPVPTHTFDFTALDTLEDLIRETADRGLSLQDAIATIIAHREAELIAQGIRYALTRIIDDTDNWLQNAIALAVASGLADELGWSEVDFAKKLGVSKQAIQQSVKTIRTTLGLRQTRMMRSEPARRKMARRNYRHFKDKDIL